MTIKLIQIGNSKGFRLPKAMIEKYAFTEELEIVETEHGLLIKPVDSLRNGWEEQFKLANADESPDDDFSDFLHVTSDFDDKEREWWKDMKFIGRIWTQPLAVKLKRPDL